MSRKRYKFNPQTLTYEVISLPFRIRFYRLLRKILIAFILATLVNTLFSYFFYTPKMYSISQQRNALILKYDILKSKIAASSDQLEGIRNRDRNVYRALFAVDTISVPGVYTPYADSKYSGFLSDHYADVISPAWYSLDDLTRKLYAQSLSMDQLEPMVQDKEKMAESIPAILPLDKRAVRNICAFGSRTDPITGRRGVMHKGMDFSGRIGTPIYASGNGRVMFELKGYRGYGKQIMLDHGFGYKTRYAHLNRINVVPGQYVKRGEKIGEMGNTGRSTGPHLHYEVLLRENAVDPVNYFSRNMSAEDFNTIIESAQETTFGE